MAKGQEVIACPGSLWESRVALPPPTCASPLRGINCVMLYSTHVPLPGRMHLVIKSLQLGSSRVSTICTRGGRGVWISFATGQMCFPGKTANRGATEDCLASGNDLIVGSPDQLTVWAKRRTTEPCQTPKHTTSEGLSIGGWPCLSPASSKDVSLREGEGEDALLGQADPCRPL